MGPLERVQAIDSPIKNLVYMILLIVACLRCTGARGASRAREGFRFRTRWLFASIDAQAERLALVVEAAEAALQGLVARLALSRSGRGACVTRHSPRQSAFLRQAFPASRLGLTQEGHCALPNRSMWPPLIAQALASNTGLSAPVACCRASAAKSTAAEAHVFIAPSGGCGTLPTQRDGRNAQAAEEVTVGSQA